MPPRQVPEDQGQADGNRNPNWCKQASSLGSGGV
ncbi:hypothetical protein DFQ14_101273 [Halopolyspora algeriensis]|uniref:Uncharacterized protein n=1 Tax=Halopolyspora algeriensis TaxID=1500506 RepID=A0A368W2M3_9ACTN|nr:hypothetical protein DFQ14_101273 [Halopolyspora algeriensis]TQM48024.1 hypothetical protein FHU43_2976 [Halopolyspora algeriensis]